jgi:hypothetical protein
MLPLHPPPLPKANTTPLHPGPSPSIPHQSMDHPVVRLLHSHTPFPTRTGDPNHGTRSAPLSSSPSACVRPPSAAPSQHHIPHPAPSPSIPHQSMDHPGTIPRFRTNYWTRQEQSLDSASITGPGRNNPAIPHQLLDHPGTIPPRSPGGGGEREGCSVAARRRRAPRHNVVTHTRRAQDA